MANRHETVCRALALLGLISVAAAGPVPPSAAPFVGKVRLPASLRAADGTVLEQGPFDLEVRSEEGYFRLRFIPSSGTPVVLSSEPLDTSDWAVPAGMPLVGTVHLHPASVPIGTDAERHKSKTGMPQYLETRRIWNATLRLYRSEDQAGTVSVLFHENHPGGPVRARFELYRAPGEGTPSGAEHP